VNGGTTWRAPFARWSHDEDADTWRLRINTGQEDAEELAGQIEQQKRLLYVAMSRARTNLIIGLHHGVGAKAPPDDPCTLLRDALDGLLPGTELVEVLAPADPALLSDRLPAPVQRASQPVARTVTSLTDAPAGTGGGRGRLHGEQVHLAISAAIERYNAEPGMGVDDLVASLDGLALDVAVATDGASILRLSTIAEAVAADERIESEYPVAGTIDGDPVYGVADIVIFKTDGSVVVGDIKTDHVGETDPAGTGYEQQLAAYRELLSNGLSVDVRSLLLGPTPAVNETS
jgi:ATP-dependent exoDNAse (exonuclease V) beta subunit